jgi:hypothetical protein
MPQAPYRRLVAALLEHVRIPQLVRLCPSCDIPMDSQATRRYTVVEICRVCGLTVLKAGTSGLPDMPRSLVRRG